MIDIHLFGKLRKYAKNQNPTEDSRIDIEFIEGETMGQLLERLNISSEEVGDVFVNHVVRNLEFAIPHAGSRIAIFDKTMYLLCGGQHLKGHGFITNKRINQEVSS
ncbi:MAG: hypothetical protein OEZ01_06860 [Candidatus Heimdallarchaeota archaeon]|nr:hypothetical protein [Candidatus Heimdallarchaeota archaeon]MDH5645710.1 hypothetical protein [Candidatus Heimdallarchaeota archaeon]